MRATTQGSYVNGLEMMQRLQSALAHTQRQISTGRRLLAPSDDPIAASRALQFRESIARLEQFDRNANIATNRLSQEESALHSVNNILQRVRELSLQANNATQSNESRRLIATEMRQQLGELVQLANQKDGNANHLFSGNLHDTQPVTQAGSTFTYNGDQGQRFIQIGEGRQVADGDSGAAIFFNIREGNGTFATAAATSNTGSGVIGAGSLLDPGIWDQNQYTVRFIDENNYEIVDIANSVVSTGTFQSGDNIAFVGIEVTIEGSPVGGDEFVVSPSRTQDVFSTVDRIASALEQGAGGAAAMTALHNAMNAGLANIDQAIGNILDVRTQVGSRLAAVENQTENNSAFALNYQETLASIEDLDYAEALSRLSLEASTLEAAQQSFIRTQSLSLFNFF